MHVRDVEKYLTKEHQHLLLSNLFGGEMFNTCARYLAGMVRRRGHFKVRLVIQFTKIKTKKIFI